MTAGHKTAFSLLISVLIFAAFTVAAFTGGFKLVETRFYQPRVVANINSELNGISGNLTEYFEAAINRFSQYASEKTVQTFVEQSPLDADVQTRTTLTGNLFAETTGLVGIRLIDSNGRYVHYSTFSKDIFKRTNKSVSYSDYDKLDEIPYSYISSSDNDIKDNSAEKFAQCCSTFFDSSNQRIIFSFPYYDKYSVFRGTLVFYVDSSDFTRFLVSRNLVTLSDTGVLIAPSSINSFNESSSEEADSSAMSNEADSDQINKSADNNKIVLETKVPSSKNSGIVFGLPAVGKDILSNAIIDKWEKGLYGTEHLVSTQNGDWLLLTSVLSKYGRIGWVYSESIFTFPDAVKVLLLICIFITLFLVVFMLFNLKHDDMVVIRDRIRKFQLALVTEYVDRKDNTDWNKVSSEISLRKNDVTNEIKKSLGRRGKKHEKELDSLLDTSWNEIISALGGNKTAAISSRTSASNEENTAQIKAMLEDILSKGNITVNAIQAPAAKVSATKASVAKKSTSVEVSDAEPVEELEEVPEAEPVEEAQPVEEVPDAEPVEELEEVPEAEPVEDVQPVEEAPDAEPVEELEEVPEAESLEDVQPVEEAQPVEEVPDAEPAEELEEAPEAEPFENDDENQEDKSDAVAKPGTVVEAAPLVEVRPEPEKIKTEPVAITTFVNDSDNVKVDDDVFVETMEFGEPPTRKETLDEQKENLPLNFSVYSPDFSTLDLKKSISKENEKAESSTVEDVEAPSAEQNLTEELEVEHNADEQKTKEEPPKAKKITENVDTSEFGMQSVTENDSAELDKEFKENLKFHNGTEPKKENAKDLEDSEEKESASEDFFSELLPGFSELDENVKPEPTEQNTTENVEVKHTASEQNKKEVNSTAKTVTEDVDTSEFGVQSVTENDSAELDKEFKENLKFDNGTEPKKENAKGIEDSEEKESASEDFFSELLPEFSELDEEKKTQIHNENENTQIAQNKKSGLLNLASYSKNKKKKGLLKAAEDFEKEESKSVQEVEILKSPDASPFSFIKFGKQDLAPEELQSEKDAIIQNDGVFEISNNLEIGNVKQDPVFKKLVESVLK